MKIINVSSWYNRVSSKEYKCFCQINSENKIKTKAMKLFPGWTLSGEGAGSGEYVLIFSRSYSFLDDLVSFLKTLPFPVNYLKKELSDKTIVLNQKTKGKKSQ
jgi:hypothetical protein